MNGFHLLIFVGLCCRLLAQDARLEQLRSSTTNMRGKPPGSGGPRGATPQLTVVKHQLRDWVESRLATLPHAADVPAFEVQLNSRLRDATLFCGEDPGRQACPDWFLLGFLNNLRIRQSGAFLIVQTGVGIECGYDESAYVYSWSAEGWRRVWEKERNTYTEKEYKPQTIHSVQISPYNRANDYLVLTLGSESWCMSNLHEVYYRAFRLGPDPLAPPLVEGAEWAFVGEYPPIQGSVARDDVLVEFVISGTDGTHRAVRHYRIDQDQVRRVDPLALRPRDFVDEWLTNDWTKAAAFWSESADRRSMREAHAKLHKDHVYGEFIFSTMHCKTADLWQIGVDFSDPPTPIGAEQKATYFLVRWRPPYQFRMVDVSDFPWAECTQEDRAADEEDHTLFPPQDR